MRLLIGSLHHKVGIYISSSDAERFLKDPDIVRLKLAFKLLITVFLMSLPTLLIHYIAG